MKVIYKYALKVTDEQVILLPAGSTILSVQEQSGVWCLWALVNPGAALKERTIIIYGTGHPVDDTQGPLLHISTFQQAAGALIWHAFERQGAI